jgi:Sulfotransferase family
MAQGDATRPVLILGLTPRTGTNYLWDLLRLHPGCAGGREPVREDFFLEHAGLLAEFVSVVRSRWDPAWGRMDEGITADLRASLGSALVRFLTIDSDRRLVTKNPSVVGIERVFDFFPTAQVMILARDGRAVVESCVRSFGWDLDLAARHWATAARTGLDFLASRGGHDPSVRLVRYEDLVVDCRGQMGQLLGFLDLSTDEYDFAAAEHLPVRGSSVFHGASSRVHWDPVERTDGFDPLRRSEHWSLDQHERFAWLAGREQVALGYPLDAAVPTTPAARVQQSWTSTQWRVRRGAKLAEYRTRGWLGPPTRPLRRRLGLTHEP